MGRADRRSTVGTPATAVLAKAGVTFTAHEYEHDPRASSYGLEAAERLGLDPHAVFKTLLADVDDRTVVAIVPVTGSLDLKALAQVAGGRKATLADPVKAQRLTGYVLGGISPVGQRRTLPTYLDDSVAGLATIYVSGGRRGLDIGVAPADLIQITGAVIAPLARTS